MNKAVMQRVYDVVLSQGDTSVVDSVLAENFTEHQTMEGMPPGREGLAQFAVMFKQAFPDLKFTVNHMTADGDLVWAHATMTGTNSGPFMGAKPTNKAVTVESFDLVRFENGKAVEHWGLSDDAGMMKQLGMTGGPPMGKK